MRSSGQGAAKFCGPIRYDLGKNEVKLGVKFYSFYFISCQGWRANKVTINVHERALQLKRVSWCFNSRSFSVLSPPYGDQE